MFVGRCQLTAAEMDGRETQGLERDGKIEIEGGEGIKSKGQPKPARSVVPYSSCKLLTIRVEEH